MRNIFASKMVCRALFLAAVTVALSDLDSLSGINPLVAKVILPVEARLVSLVMVSVWLRLKLMRSG